MARYKTGNSAKDRKNRPCDGYRNWDTAATVIVIRNDSKCRKFIERNADALLGMHKKTKLQLLERNSAYGFGGVSYQNVDYRELNSELERLTGKKAKGKTASKTSRKSTK